MKKLSTNVSTGDSFTSKGINYLVGLNRCVNGKMVIDLKVKINATSGYTIQVSTRTLNQMIKNN